MSGQPNKWCGHERLGFAGAIPIWREPPRDTLRRRQWWDVTGTVGGFVLAAVTTMGGLYPVIIWTALAVIAACRFLAPGDKTRTTRTKYKTEKTKRNYKTRLVDMGTSMIRELAKAAPITVLFHTVGIDALSL